MFKSRNDLFDDIRNDDGFLRNIRRILVFILFLSTLDLFISLILEKGINRYYGLDSNAEVVLIGHSHLMLALDKTMLENILGVKVAKYTRPGVNVADRLVMLQHYFTGDNKNCRAVVYSIDPWLFTTEGLSKNSYTLFYPFMDNQQVDRYIYSETKDTFDYFRHKLFRSSRFDALLLNAAIRGYLGSWSNLKYGKLNKDMLDIQIAAGDYRKINIDKRNIDYFEENLKFLKNKNIKVVILNTPIYHVLTDIQKEKYLTVMTIIKNMSLKYHNVYYLDLSPQYSYANELFYDPIHLNPDGQKYVTKKFAKILDSLIAR